MQPLNYEPNLPLRLLLRLIEVKGRTSLRLLFGKDEAVVLGDRSRWLG